MRTVRIIILSFILIATGLPAILYFILGHNLSETLPGILEESIGWDSLWDIFVYLNFAAFLGAILLFSLVVKK